MEAVRPTQRGGLAPKSKNSLNFMFLVQVLAEPAAPPAVWEESDGEASGAEHSASTGSRDAHGSAASAPASGDGASNLLGYFSMWQVLLYVTYSP